MKIRFPLESGPFKGFPQKRTGLAPPEEGVPACLNCVHWNKITKRTGECRRMPPSAAGDDTYRWPITGQSDSCGEYRE